MTKFCAECKKDDIESKVIARGLCWKHYRRLLRHGELTAVSKRGSKSSIRIVPTRCLEGCSNDNGKSICQRCRQKTLYDFRRKQGLCHSCGGNLKGLKQCEKCRIKTNKKRNETRRNGRLKE